ncbi:V-type ATPase subunit [candidate division KSB1 bacterium]|nr:V-type ATPase subunit [candidate division KSB1 bacterium]
MTSALTKYAFINAKLRARLSKNLPDDLIDEMVKAKSFLESIEYLRDTPYDTIYDVYTETGDMLTAEKELLKKEILLFIELLRYVDEKTGEYIKALALRYEISNLKNCIRLFFDRFIRGRDISLQTPYLIHEKIVNDYSCDRIIHASSREELLEALKDTPYRDLVKSATDELNETFTVFPIEMALDRFYYDNVFIRLSSCLPGKDKTIALQVFNLDVDVENIGRMVRFKHFYAMDADKVFQYILPYGIVPLNIDVFKKMYENEDVSGILAALMEKSDRSLKTFFNQDVRERQARLLFVEKIAEHVLLYQARKILFGPPFTIGILLAYLILKQNEIKKIMTVLNAKNYNYQPERIHGLL